jgi:hypothetical protein
MAGWNQTMRDWSALLYAGQGFGMRGPDGRLVASIVVLRYPPRLGWIGMVLVDENYRHRGIATRLMRHGIEILQADGLIPMLDATPDGRKVYERLGFTPLAPIQRWRGTAIARERRGLSRWRTPELDAAIALDAAAFGAPRRRLLLGLAARLDALSLKASHGHGYLFSRAGRTATQIGPVLAESEATGVALCERALDRLDGEVLLDVPVRETAIAAMLEARGLTVERSFTRMALGDGGPFSLGPAMRIVAGPELG